MNNVFTKSAKRILVTGGAGFIGGALIRRLLSETNCLIFNLDKIGYASDTTQIETLLKNSPLLADRYNFYKFDLSNEHKLDDLLREINPDYIFHLAAESHVDRSIEGPKVFLESNIIGTFNLLQSARQHWENMHWERKEFFCFQHISTDEVFGSLGDTGAFSELTPYDPRSPYSASKAASDHLVQSWHHTYGIPILITNCSNNFGPWQYPEKLIPLAISKALDRLPIPMYGDGSNIRDWLFIDDHIDALILVASLGKKGSKYCIGGYGQKTNYEILKLICENLNDLQPKESSYENLISSVSDRPGHDFRYAIDSTLITNELGWVPKFSLEKSLRITTEWYVNNREWVSSVLK